MQTRTQNLIANLIAEVQSLSGRRGVTARRSVLEAVQLAASKHHHQLTSHRVARSQAAIERTRRRIADLANWSPSRGEWQEFRLPYVPADWRTHPALTLIARISTLMETAKAECLPRESQKWDAKRRGSGLSIDLYGWSQTGPLLLVQVRETSRSGAKRFLNVKKTYLVTDGFKASEIPGALIRKAAQVDPSPDAPLRAVRKHLPAEWQRFVPDEPVKLPAPVVPVRECYKVLAQNGRLESVFDGSPYELGKWRSEKAREDHGGGFYAYADAEEAIAAAARNEIFGYAWADGKELVLVRCEAKGTPIEYSDNKLAYSMIRPVAVVRTIEH